jgi:hypothetical protein
MTKTAKRAEFNRLFGQLSVFAQLRGIRFIHDNYGYYRTPEQQHELYREGKSNCDGYAILSKHPSHLARDIYVINDRDEIEWNDGPYRILGEYWESLGGRWGGHFVGTSFRDPFHFELE